LHWHNETWFPVRQIGSELAGDKGGEKKNFLKIAITLREKSKGKKRKKEKKKKENLHDFELVA